MLDKNTIVDCILILLVFVALFLVPGWLTEAVDSNYEMHRGCVASAYQAEIRGFDLEENLKHCKQYETE